MSLSTTDEHQLWILSFLLCGVIAAVAISGAALFVIKRHSRTRDKLQNLTQPDSEASKDYQVSCVTALRTRSFWHVRHVGHVCFYLIVVVRWCVCSDAKCEVRRKRAFFLRLVEQMLEALPWSMNFPSLHFRTCAELGWRRRRPKRNRKVASSATESPTWRGSRKGPTIHRLQDPAPPHGRLFVQNAKLTKISSFNLVP